jgi:hypothetical protein
MCGSGWAKWCEFRMAAFSQYIVYADESGSPVLGADAKDFPVFVLVFLIV